MNISSDHLQLVRAILQQHVPGHTVWAFGYRVHGRNLTPFSDLDLAVVSERPLGIEQLIALRAAFSESVLPFRVDVVDYVEADPGFRAIIDAYHEPVTRGQKQAGQETHPSMRPNSSE